VSVLGGSFLALCASTGVKCGTFYGHQCLVRKLLDSRILEVPLIVLQYYKPSIFLSIYIYISIKRRIMIYHYLEIKFLISTNVVGCREESSGAKKIGQFRPNF
jgi:hypothetical protein